MKEDCEERAEFVAWVNKEKQIVTFHNLENFEKLIFKTHEDMISHVYNLCEAGYRLM